MSPDFLIIGAMKAGTTTLYQDIAQHPKVFLPLLKEPETLVKHNDPKQIADKYAAMFRRSAPDALRGEGSTAYTKRPDHVGIAERAFEVCGPALKLIYITREPVARMISHYHHQHQHGHIVEPFAEAIDEHPALINYSRYEWQLQPWVDRFGHDQILRLEMESYATDRMGQLGRVLDFLGLDRALIPALDVTRIVNQARDAKTLREGSMLKSLLFSGFYRQQVKPLIPQGVRDWVRERILPPPKIAELEISAETRAKIVRLLQSPPPDDGSLGHYASRPGSSLTNKVDLP